MTYDLTVRDEDGNTIDLIGTIKDFVTYVKIAGRITEDKISDSVDEFISIDIFPDRIRTRYRGNDGKDRKINVVYTKDIMGYDVILENL